MSTVEDIQKLMLNNEDSSSIEKLLDKLLVKDKNLILKTDIENTVQFTLLTLMKETLKTNKLKRSAKTLEMFLDKYIEVRVSKSRSSRKEILDAISSIRKEQSNSITSKLLGVTEK